MNKVLGGRVEDEMVGDLRGSDSRSSDSVEPLKKLMNGELGGKLENEVFNDLRGSGSGGSDSVEPLKKLGTSR
eukprot:8567130-Heterocapsa_arctica.AAC.1